EGGNKFLRITSPNYASNHAFIVFYRLPTNWQTLTVSARVRTHNLKTKPDYGGARIAFDFYQMINQQHRGIFWAQAGETVKQDTDWVLESGTVQRSAVPSNDSVIPIGLYLDKAVGAADFDDIKVSVVEENGASNGSAGSLAVETQIRSVIA